MGELEGVRTLSYVAKQVLLTATFRVYSSFEVRTNIAILSGCVIVHVRVRIFPEIALVRVG